MERLIGEQMALPCALFNTRTAGPRRLREGTGWCREGAERRRISKSAEKFAGIEGLEVMVEMSGQKENVKVRHVARSQGG